MLPRFVNMSETARQSLEGIIPHLPMFSGVRFEEYSPKDVAWIVFDRRTGRKLATFTNRDTLRDYYMPPSPLNYRNNRANDIQNDYNIDTLTYGTKLDGDTLRRLRRMGWRCGVSIREVCDGLMVCNVLQVLDGENEPYRVLYCPPFDILEELEFLPRDRWCEDRRFRK